MSNSLGPVGGSQPDLSIIDKVNQQVATANNGAWNSVDVSAIPDFKVQPRLGKEKSFESLSIKDRAVKKLHQLALFHNKKPISQKVWKPIDIKAIQAENPLDPVGQLNEDLEMFNGAVEYCSQLDSVKKKVKANVEAFKHKNKDALKFIKDFESGKSFKFDQKIKIADENGNVEVIRFKSHSKSVNRDTAGEIVKVLKQREDYSAHMQNKHALNSLSDEVSKVKEELYQLESRIKSAYKGNLKHIHEADKNTLRTAKRTHKAEARVKFKENRELALEAYKEHKKFIRDFTNEQVDSKMAELKSVRKAKAKNNDLIKEEKALLPSDNVFKRMFRKLGSTPLHGKNAAAFKEELKKQRAVVEDAVETLQENRTLQKRRTAELKAGIKADKKQGRRREYDLNGVKGHSLVAKGLAKAGLYTKVGWGEGGVLSRLRSEKNQALAEAQGIYKKRRAEARKEYHAAKADFGKRLRGETLSRQAVIEKLGNNGYKDTTELWGELLPLNNRDLNKVEEWVYSHYKGEVEVDPARSILETIQEVRGDQVDQSEEVVSDRVPLIKGQKSEFFESEDAKADFDKRLIGETVSRETVIAKLDNDVYENAGDFWLEISNLNNQDLNKVEEWVHSNSGNKVGTDYGRHLLNTIQNVREDQVDQSEEVVSDGVPVDLRFDSESLSKEELSSANDFIGSLAERDFTDSKWVTGLENFSIKQLNYLGEQLALLYDGETTGSGLQMNLNSERFLNLKRDINEQQKVLISGKDEDKDSGIGMDSLDNDSVFDDDAS